MKGRRKPPTVNSKPPMGGPMVHPRAIIAVAEPTTSPRCAGNASPRIAKIESCASAMPLPEQDGRAGRFCQLSERAFLSVWTRPFGSPCTARARVSNAATKFSCPGNSSGVSPVKIELADTCATPHSSTGFLP
jgi:hypothetical protein